MEPPHVGCYNLHVARQGRGGSFQMCSASWPVRPGPFRGWFYPSTRQHYAFGRAYKSSTRQVTRQKPSGTRQETAKGSIKEDEPPRKLKRSPWALAFRRIGLRLWQWG